LGHNSYIRIAMVKNERYLVKGDVFREARESRDLRYREVYYDTDISTSIIHKIENCVFYNPTIKVLLALCDYYELDINDVVYHFRE